MSNLKTKADKAFTGLTKILNRRMSSAFKTEDIAEMEVQDFQDYKELAKSYQEFSELAMDMFEELDNYSRQLDELQKDMKKVLEKR